MAIIVSHGNHSVTWQSSCHMAIIVSHGNHMCTHGNHMCTHGSTKLAMYARNTKHNKYVKERLVF